MEENTNATQEVNVEKQEEQNEEDYKSKYLYLLAEVDNYKKSKEKELVEYIKYSNERLITDLLKVLDDFDSVLKQDNDEKVKALYKAFLSVLCSICIFFHKINLIYSNISIFINFYSFYPFPSSHLSFPLTL